MQNVLAAVRSGWISSSGEFLDRFETSWAERCDRRHGISVTNGTAALELAVSSLELRPGDEVVMPSFTIVSCALAAVRNGLRPVFVDVDEDSWTISPDRVEEAAGARTAALMSVDMYGHPADYGRLLPLTQGLGIPLLADAAESHGAEARVGDAWRPSGSFGEIATFSFYANKLVTTGEGGMIVTDDDGIAERARRRRNLSFGTGRRFFHDELGYNLRMTNLQAALGVGQIDRLDDIIARKRRLAAWYCERLASVETLRLQREQRWARSVHWMFGVVVEPATGLDAEAVALSLREAGIDTRPFFFGLHRQPIFADVSTRPLPVTEHLTDQGFYLPSGLSVTENQVDRICDVLTTVLSKPNRR